MLAVGFLLCAFTSFGLTRAGEIVLYKGKCDSTNRIIFSANETTNCQQLQYTAPFGNISTSTSRNIGNSCTFNFYKDTKCATFITKITSSGPYKSCVPLATGFQSYKITCTGHVNANLVRPMEDSIYTPSYFQPLATYRGKPSGHHEFEPYASTYGGSVSKKPTGDPSAAGIRLASAFFSKVPSGSNVFTYTVTAVDGGTSYTLSLSGDKDNGYTAETAVRAMGYASFASLLADTLAYLNRRPSAWYINYLDDFDAGDKEIGNFNITYVAP